MDIEGCMIKKGLTWFGIVVLILLACIGLHRSVLWIEHATAKSMIEQEKTTDLIKISSTIERVVTRFSLLILSITKLCSLSKVSGRK
jgi:hypothetical protein